MNAIEVDRLSFSYPRVQVLNSVTFNVDNGAFVAVVGPNGCGKSTLINLLCGLLKPQAGSIKIDGKPIQSYSTQQLAKQLAVVRQQIVSVFEFTVAETVLISRTTSFTQAGFETKTDRQIVLDALKLTDTEKFASRKLSQLSGGERQRVFIARALAQDTPVLLLDEPTSFLDLKHQVAIYDLLKDAQLTKGKTVFSVTHDINLAAQYADSVLLLADDKTYLYGTVEQLFQPEKIQKVFGVKTFSPRYGGQKFFIPLGKFAT